MWTKKPYGSLIIDTTNGKRFLSNLDSELFIGNKISANNKDEFDTIPRLKEERYSLHKQLEIETNLTIDEIMEIKDRIKHTKLYRFSYT